VYSLSPAPVKVRCSLLSRDTFHCRYIREGHALGCISIPALVRGRPSTALTPTQDPAQYLVPNVALRQLPSYHAPEKYGTITGDAFAPNVPVPATKPKEMKDGAMDFSGGKKAEKEKKEEGKVKEVAVKKETKSVEQPKKVSWSRSWSWGQTWTWSRCAEFCGWTSHG
jgi:hypothetical protein